MTPEQFLKGLQKDLHPSADLKAKIQKSIQSRIACDSPLFADLKHTVSPKNSLQNTVWNRISSQIELPQAHAFTRIKIAFQPSAQLKEQIKAKVLASLEPVQRIAYWPLTAKWTAAFALFGILVRISPMLFIASPTVAETEVLLIPTRGEVSVSIGEMWQPVEGEIALEPGMKLRTHDGEASIVLHDDGVIRLDKMTTVELQDLADRLEPASEIFPTLTLYTGKLWVQGLVPPQLRGITVTTSHGHVTVNEGSVSITEDDAVEVEVYDRLATVQKNGEQVFLASGERTRLYEENVLLVKKVPAKWYQYTWANQNLMRDAVHRHDIAQMQHERRIAQAGILPTSRFYAVKRFAELMDVWLTFDQEARVSKKLQGAETRLNEAAALIYNGDEANIVLEEYRDTLQALASGEHHGSLAEFLVQRAIAGSTAKMTAALPGDESYAIKKMVLETSAKISGGSAQQESAQGTLLLDGLAVMMRSAEEGRIDLVQSVWSDLHPYVLAIESTDTALDPAMYKEAKMLLTFLASSLHIASNRGASVDPELLDDIAMYLPAPRDTTDVSLSEEEVMHIVMTIKEKIFIYDMTQPRINQFIAEIKSLNGHPDQGRILRRLAFSLPDGPESFPQRVYKEIVKLRWENAAGEVI